MSPRFCTKHTKPDPRCPLCCPVDPEARVKEMGEELLALQRANVNLLHDIDRLRAKLNEAKAQLNEAKDERARLLGEIERLGVKAKHFQDLAERERPHRARPR